MFAFSGQPDRPSLRMLMLHDDADREFDYVAAPSRPSNTHEKRTLEHAREENWNVVSMKNDWTSVFSPAVT